MTMAWFRFEKPFDFSPDAKKGHVTIAYKPGTYNVTRQCAEKAKAEGAGRAVKATKDKSEDGAEA